MTFVGKSFSSKRGGSHDFLLGEISSARHEIHFLVFLVCFLGEAGGERRPIQLK